MRAIVTTEEGTRTVTLVKCDATLIKALTSLVELSADSSDLLHMLYELNETYRIYIANQFGKEYEIMVFAKFKIKIDSLFDRLIARTTNLPAINKVAVEAKKAIDIRLAELQPQLEKLFIKEDFDKGVDFLVLVLKGSLRTLKIPAPGFLGWLLGKTLPIDPIIDSLGQYMKANRELFADGIADGNPLAEVE
jgi:hypothetical protein